MNNTQHDANEVVTEVKVNSELHGENELSCFEELVKAGVISVDAKKPLEWDSHRNRYRNDHVNSLLKAYLTGRLMKTCSDQ